MSLCGVVANVLDCEIVVSEFELRLCDYIQLRINSCEIFLSPNNDRIPVPFGSVKPVYILIIKQNKLLEIFRFNPFSEDVFHVVRC